MPSKMTPTSTQTQMFHSASVVDRSGTLATPVGSISLVLLPGIDGTGVLFDTLLPALGQKIKPVVVRYPRDLELTYQQLLPLVMAELPSADPFVVLGESFGGPLALMVAARRPVNLRGVILCTTFVTPPVRYVGWAIPLLSRLLLLLIPVARWLAPKMGSSPDTQIRRTLAKARSQFSPAMIAFRLRTLFKVDVRQELRGCDVPLLCIAAKDDRVVRGRNLRMIRQVRPDVKVVTIPGPHRLPLMRPREVADAISAFVDSCTRPS